MPGVFRHLLVVQRFAGQATGDAFSKIPVGIILTDVGIIGGIIFHPDEKIISEFRINALEE